jgi:hypothetical protein
MENSWRAFGEQNADFAFAVQRQSRFLVTINTAVF